MDMVKIDLHVHSSRYSHCSSITPDQLADMAPFLPIDGMVITEHDALWTKEELAELQNKSGTDLRFYRGTEVTCDEGHFLVYGLDSVEGLYPDMPLKELTALSEKNRAAVVAAHPGRFFPLPPENPGEEWKAVHAVESMSFNIRQALAPGIRYTLDLLGKPPVAGSDSHGAWAPGLYATLFPRLPENEKELAEMLRQGLGIPWANEKGISAIQKEIPEAKLLLEPPLPLPVDR